MTMRHALDSSATLKRIKAARTGLIHDKPFFGILSLKLQLLEDVKCKTFWTDGTHLGFNPDFADRLSYVELQGVICHEVLHCAAGHCHRRGGRDKEAWNEAADYAINPIVLEAGYKLPEGVLLDLANKGKPAEWFYNRRQQEKKQQQQ